MNGNVISRTLFSSSDFYILIGIFENQYEKLIGLILHSMKKHQALTLAITLFSTILAAHASAENLCSQNEKKLFECGFQNSTKSVSICQSPTDRKIITYKYGTSSRIEITLPNEKSGPPYIHFEHYGPSVWIKQVIFPVGKIQYIINTPEGISALLLVEGIKNPISMTCGTGDSGSEVANVYDLMEELKFKKK